MKLQRSTWILLVVALGLGGGVLWLERQFPSQPEAAAPQGQPIFSFSEDQVQTLRLQTQEQTLVLRRGAAPAPSPSLTPNGAVPQLPELSSTSTWQMQQPVQAPASDAAVTYLLNLMATGTADQALAIPASRKAEFGFEQPLATVDVTLEDQSRHRLVLGKFNFNESYLYALADPPASTSQTLTVLLVPTVFENAVNRPLAEWQNRGKGADQAPAASNEEPPP